MRQLARFVVVLSLAVGVALPAMAGPAPRTAPSPAYTENGFQPGMLDTSRPLTERLQQFNQLVALANSGQVLAQDLAGTLYWRGSAIAGSPVAANLDRARVLLANASVHGDVLAMAKLGELELGAGRTTQAMIWAQMYARYIDPLAPERSRRGRGAAYASSLIQRIAAAGGNIDDTTSADVAAMVQRFDKSIRRGIDALNAERRHGRTFLTRYPMGRDTTDVANINGVVEFMVGFDAKGNRVGTWFLDAFPDATLRKPLRDYLKNIQANVAGDASGTRYLRIPIVHNARKFRSLRAVH